MRQGGFRPQPSQNMRDFSKDFKSEWISDNLKSETILFADQFAADLKSNKFTTSQIRNFFGEVKRIQMKGFNDNRTSFLLLKPKLSYAAVKAEGNGARMFEGVMKKALDAVKPDDPAAEKRFSNFCDFFEAILAYHKAHGGK